MSCRYVLRIQSDIELKVSTVAKGFGQVPGVKFHDTYAPVISLYTA